MKKEKLNVVSLDRSDKQETVPVYFRCYRKIVERFDSIIEAKGLRRGDVLRTILRDFNESAVSSYETATEKLKRFEGILSEFRREEKLIQKEIAAMKKGM